jgi:isoleucyl-tRNA synthetase
VEHVVDQLLKNSDLCYWVPEFVQEKQFGNWLKDAPDWAMSRNRSWGTPIPLWSVKTAECGERIMEVAIFLFDGIDHLTIPSHWG